MKVIKRDGRIENFNYKKIEKAINKSIGKVSNKLSNTIQYSIYNDILNILNNNTNNNKITVENIHKAIEKSLYNKGLNEIANSYSSYRNERTKIRDLKSELMKSIDKIGIETDRDNANVGNNFSSKLLRIASESNKWHNLAMMPKKLSRLYENGDLHYHDLDSFNLTTNCLHIGLKQILKKGINTGYGTLRPPKRIISAAEIACIVLQSNQNDHFGGQAYPNFCNDMAFIVDMTRKEIINELKEYGINDINIINKKLKKEIKQAMQSIVYNLNTMHSRAGSQVPFSSINIGIPLGNEQEKKDSALLCELFLKEYEKGLGKGEQPIFPSIIFRVKDGINKKQDDPYYYLFKLACKVASKRMNPTFMNMDADFNLKYYKKGYIPALMGCRTYLMSNINGDPGVEGRGNIAPTTINLPRLGIFANHDIDKFFQLLNERLNDSKDSLIYRYNILKKLKVKDLPFSCGEKLMKGSENLNKNDSIELILKQGTYAIGYIGLAETLTSLIGKHHGETKKARKLGYKIIKTIRNFVDKTTLETGLNFSCYATPSEGLCSRFVEKDRKKFGIIKGVTDKKYYTNSFHIPVAFPISISDKVTIEAPYHKLSNGGHISYVELDNYPSPNDIERIVYYTFTYTNMSYLGINFHIKYCKECGTYLNDKDKVCSKCGSNKIQGISRVTGYLSLDERFGVGKEAERNDRKSNNGLHKVNYTL